MSKISHTIYLSIVGILLAVIFINIVMERPSEQLRSQPKRIALFPLVALDSSSATAAETLTRDLEEIFSEAKYAEVISKVELKPELRSSADHHLWAGELSADLILEGTVESDNERFLVTVQVIDGLSNEHGWNASFTVDGQLLAQLAKEIEERVFLLYIR